MYYRYYGFISGCISVPLMYGTSLLDYLCFYLYIPYSDNDLSKLECSAVQCIAVMTTLVNYCGVAVLMVLLSGQGQYLRPYQDYCAYWRIELHAYETILQ